MLEELQALESACVGGGIALFATFLAEPVHVGLEGKAVPVVPE